MISETAHSDTGGEVLSDVHLGWNPLTIFIFAIIICYVFIIYCLPLLNKSTGFSHFQPLNCHNWPATNTQHTRSQSFCLNCAIESTTWYGTDCPFGFLRSTITLSGFFNPSFLNSWESTYLNKVLLFHLFSCFFLFTFDLPKIAWCYRV